MKFIIFYSLLVLACAFVFYGFFIEPNRLEINYVDLRTEFKYSPTDPITIIQISDIHLKEIGSFERRIIRKINEIDPDLILLSGDYIAWKHDPAPAIHFFSKLKARHGVYAVMGDYDYSNSRNSCLFCHEPGAGNLTKAHPVKMLRNSGQKITIKNRDLYIFGIDNAYAETDGLEILNGLERSGVKLILSHDPLIMNQLVPDLRATVFAGDTHGGQIKLPGFIFKWFGYNKNYQYNGGLFGNGKNRMYVTRGIGTSHIRFRFLCPPEITVFHL